jgi:hypothetical protein
MNYGHFRAESCVFSSTSAKVIQAISQNGTCEIINSEINAISTGAGVSVNCVNGTGACILDHCTLTATSSQASTVVAAIFGTNSNTTINNCTVSASSPAAGANVYGIYLTKDSASATVTDCTIYADGYSDCDTDNDGEQEIYGVGAICSTIGSTLVINGGYYWGAREALGIYGTARINGGIFEGCQHGGGYLGGADVKIKNATLRNIEYTGNCGWGTDGEGHHGSVYCGGDGIDDVNIYFDNCRFEAEKSVGTSLCAKCTGTKVYLSNCTFDNNYRYASLRVDDTCTIYIGKNVYYDVETILENDTGFIDITTYADQEFRFETESTNYENLIDIKTGLLAAQKSQVQIITWEEDD